MNKIKRLETVFEGGVPDCTPAGFWFHYPGSWGAKATAEAHLELYRYIGADIIKIMDDSTGCHLAECGQISSAQDLRGLAQPGVDCAHFRRMAEIVGRLADAVSGEVMLFPTVWCPLKIISFAYAACGRTEADLMGDCRADPDSVLRGAEAVASMLEEFVAGYIKKGADGIYYSAQFSEPGRFSDPEWAMFIKAMDLRVIGAAKKAGKRAIVHICGEPEYEFRTTPERYADYPGDMFNWAVHRNDLGLTGGRALFKRPVLGGMHNRGVLISGEEAAIRAEARYAIAQAGKNGFMLGADCTVPSDVSLDRLKYAVDEAHRQ